MSEYRYSQLSPTSIRLLRLLPSEKDQKPLRCELFEYTLQNSGKSSHPYEALSYVWGSEDKPETITINDHSLNITQNLYTVLLHLRDHACSRIIWVDAICIHQADEKEKGHQIQFMAAIFAKANRVIVWLGEAQEDSDQALKSIRIAGEKSTKPSNVEQFQRAILQLLKRSWFRRIWILQEVAAAQHILIMCGSTKIDGYAFCLGLEFLNTVLEDSTCLVTYLIRGAIFRSGHVSGKQGRLSLDICSLGELVDMYHTHEATKRHDKVYALLGMSSDDLSTAGLQPDYSVPWETLMQSLIKFLLGNHPSVYTWDDREIVVIKSKGCVLGQVTQAFSNTTKQGNRKDIEITFKYGLENSKHDKNREITWTLPPSAKPIKEGDVICLLQGAMKPTIIRLCKDYFTIIVIAATPPEHMETEWPKYFTREFLLIWNWEKSLEDLQDSGEYNTLIRISSKVGLEDKLDNAIRAWNVAQILGDLEEYKKAMEKGREAVEVLERMLGEENPHILESKYGLIPLSLATRIGHEEVVAILLTEDSVDLDSKDSEGRTPLSWAAGNGHEAVVKLLLKTGKAGVDSKDRNSRTPLSWAAGNGHEAVVKLLLETGKADVDSKGGSHSRTPLSWAAGNGHEAVVKLLLETGKADVDSRGDSYSRTPLSWAAGNGHEAVIKLLLETGKADVDSEGGSYSRTPLSWAAGNGHEAVAKLLLETGKADVDSKRSHGRTPLSWAAGNGHEAVVKLLLETGKADVDSEGGIYDRTPLSWAAENGHGAVAKLLLETGKADIDSKGWDSRTPLSWAAENGHEAVAKLLLETGKADVDSKGWDSRTPLSWAAGNRHEAVVKLLQSYYASDITVKVV